MRTKGFCREIRPVVEAASMKSIVLILGLSMALLSPVLAAPPFTSISLQQAQAQSGERWVVAFFTASWCGPCQTMKKNTWPDPQVKDWLDKRAIAVMIDADQHKELARSLGIKALPTTIIWRHGKEQERLAGACRANQMVEWLQSLDRGQGRLEELRQAARQGPPSAQLEYAQALLDNRKWPEALEVTQALWKACLEEENPGSEAWRLPALVDPLLANSAAAEPFFRQEHLQLRQRLLEQEKSAEHTWGLWLELSRLLKSEEEAIAVFRRFQSEGELERLAPARLRYYHLLLKHELWPEAGVIVDPEFTTRHFLSNRQDIVEAAAELSPDNPERMKTLARTSAEKNLCKLHRALLEAGRAEEAQRVLDLWGETDGTAAVQSAIDGFRGGTR